MADREVALTTVKGGINRLRTKGAALEDSLYDLLNGYVTAAKTVVVRPGTFRVAVLPTDTEGNGITHGLCAFQNLFHVFSIEDVDVPPGYVNHILVHPTDTSLEITDIHFAAPYMGYLYVVAEFSDGVVQHYWLQSGDVWEADTIYHAGDIVVPSDGGSLSFQASRSTPANISWAPNVTREVGDVIEPTEYNDYYYTVIDTQGDNPRSGATEPVWPTEPGATITEDADGTDTTPPALTEPPDPDAQPSQAAQDRYSNLLGKGR